MESKNQKENQTKFKNFKFKSQSQCTFCPTTFLDFEEKLDHLTECHNDKAPLQCLYCSKRFWDQEKKSQHLERYHKDKSNEKISEKQVQNYNGGNKQDSITKLINKESKTKPKETETEKLKQNVKNTSSKRFIDNRYGFFVRAVSIF